ncbi:hypothetical protein ACP4OV_028223 [Aristida adscensionis]
MAPEVFKEEGATAAAEGDGTEVAAAAGNGTEVAAVAGMITLTSFDGTSFQVPEAAARLSERLRVLMEEGRAGDAFPLPYATSATLETVVAYCTKHAEADTAGANSYTDDPADAAGFGSTEVYEGLEAWDRELVRGLDDDELFRVINAADELKIEGLLDVACRKVADMMRGKTVKQIRETFHIKDDFTDAERREMNQEYAWALEPSNRGGGGGGVFHGYNDFLADDDDDDEYDDDDDNDDDYDDDDGAN